MTVPPVLRGDDQAEPGQVPVVPLPQVDLCHRHRLGADAHQQVADRGLLPAVAHVHRATEQCRGRQERGVDRVGGIEDAARVLDCGGVVGVVLLDAEGLPDLHAHQRAPGGAGCRTNIGRTARADESSRKPVATAGAVPDHRVSTPDPRTGA